MEDLRKRRRANVGLALYCLAAQAAGFTGFVKGALEMTEAHISPHAVLAFDSETREARQKVATALMVSGVAVSASGILVLGRIE